MNKRIKEIEKQILEVSKKYIDAKTGHQKKINDYKAIINEQILKGDEALSIADVDTYGECQLEKAKYQIAVDEMEKQLSKLNLNTIISDTEIKGLLKEIRDEQKNIELNYINKIIPLINDIEKIKREYDSDIAECENVANLLRMELFNDSQRSDLRFIHYYEIGLDAFVKTVLEDSSLAKCKAEARK